MWMIWFNLLESTPMWTGWNAELFIEKCLRQHVEYMHHISFPLTRTILQSKRVSEECGSTFAVIILSFIHCKN